MSPIYGSSHARRSPPACVYDRRNWLAVAAAGLLIGGASSSGQEASGAPIGLGFSLYGLPKHGLLEAVRLCAEIGYDSVELALLPNYPTDPQSFSSLARRQLRESLAEHRLAAAAMMENLPLSREAARHAQQKERIRRAAEVAHELSPQAPPPLETVLGGKPGEWDEFKTLAVDRLGDWAALAARLQLVVCVKPHAGSAFNRPDHAVWLIEQIQSPWLRLAYDYSHFEHRGFSLAETMEQLIPLSPFVHLKDRAEDDGPLRFLLPGEGVMDYTQYARSLARSGYRGQAAVEVSAQLHRRPDYDGRAAATRCYERLAAAWRAAGVSRPRRG